MRTPAAAPRADDDASGIDAEQARRFRTFRSRTDSLADLCLIEEDGEEHHQDDRGTQRNDLDPGNLESTEVHQFISEGCRE